MKPVTLAVCSIRYLFVSVFGTPAQSDEIILFRLSLPVSMAGLTLGVAVLILVLSVLNGFDRELRTRILGTVPHAVLEFGSARTDLASIAEQLLINPSIIGVAPLNQGEGLLIANGRTASVAVLGVNPEQESQVSILPGFMTQGNFVDLNRVDFQLS